MQKSCDRHENWYCVAYMSRLTSYAEVMTCFPNGSDASQYISFSHVWKGLLIFLSGIQKKNAYLDKSLHKLCNRKEVDRGNYTLAPSSF